MEWIEASTDNCPVGMSLDLLGEKWTLLIVRDALNGVRRFEQFRRHMGLSEAVLADRLQKLVTAGVLELRPYREEGRRERNEYRLTAAGLELLPVILSLKQWGERHLGDPAERVIEVVIANAAGPPASSCVARGIPSSSSRRTTRRCVRRRRPTRRLTRTSLRSAVGRFNTPDHWLSGTSPAAAANASNAAVTATRSSASSRRSTFANSRRRALVTSSMIARAVGDTVSATSRRSVRHGALHVSLADQAFDHPGDRRRVDVEVAGQLGVRQWAARRAGARGPETGGGSGGRVELVHRECGDCDESATPAMRRRSLRSWTWRWTWPWRSLSSYNSCMNASKWVPIRRREELRELAKRSREAILLAALVGLVTGAAVALMDWVTIDGGLERVLSLPAPVRVWMPMLGLAVVAVILRLGRIVGVSTSDEYIKTFHSPDELDLAPVPRRLAAGIVSVASGVPFGLEAASLYLGASVGSAFQRRFRSVMSSTDVHSLMVAGAAARVAAIFKTPATGAGVCARSSLPR